MAKIDLSFLKTVYTLIATILKMYKQNTSTLLECDGHLNLKALAIDNVLRFMISDIHFKMTQSIFYNVGGD